MKKNNGNMKKTKVGKNKEINKFLFLTEDIDPKKSINNYKKED